MKRAGQQPVLAAEEAVAYQLAPPGRETELIASNATFGALLFSGPVQQNSAPSERQNRHELQSLSMARSSDEAVVRPALSMPAPASSTWRSSSRRTASAALVRDRLPRPAWGSSPPPGCSAILSGTRCTRWRWATWPTTESYHRARPSDPIGESWLS